MARGPHFVSILISTSSNTEGISHSSIGLPKGCCCYTLSDLARSIAAQCAMCNLSPEISGHLTWRYLQNVRSMIFGCQGHAHLKIWPKFGRKGPWIETQKGQPALAKTPWTCDRSKWGTWWWTTREYPSFGQTLTVQTREPACFGVPERPRWNMMLRCFTSSMKPFAKTAWFPYDLWVPSRCGPGGFNHHSLGWKVPTCLHRHIKEWCAA